MSRAKGEQGDQSHEDIDAPIGNHKQRDPGQVAFPVEGEAARRAAAQRQPVGGVIEQQEGTDNSHAPNHAQP